MSSLRLKISMRRPGSAAMAFHLTGVPVVGPNQLEPVEPLAYFVEDQGRAVAILDAGGVDDHAQWETFGIDQGVELASFDLLSGVVTHCVVFTPVLRPFSATSATGRR